MQVTENVKLAYGEGYMNVRTVQYWLAKFKADDFSLEIELRDSRKIPLTMTFSRIFLKRIYNRQQNVEIAVIECISIVQSILRTPYCAPEIIKKQNFTRIQSSAQLDDTHKNFTQDLDTARLGTCQFDRSTARLHTFDRPYTQMQLTRQPLCLSFAGLFINV